MTKEEWAAFRRWCDKHEGWVVSYGFVAWCAFLIAMIILYNGNAFGGLVYVLLPALVWPAVLFAINATVLSVRYRTNRNLKLERKLQRIEERERRVAQLEREAGI